MKKKTVRFSDTNDIKEFHREEHEIGDMKEALVVSMENRSEAKKMSKEMVRTGFICDGDGDIIEMFEILNVDPAAGKRDPHGQRQDCKKLNTDYGVGPICNHDFSRGCRCRIIILVDGTRKRVYPRDGPVRKSSQIGQ